VGTGEDRFPSGTTVQAGPGRCRIGLYALPSASGRREADGRGRVSPFRFSAALSCPYPPGVMGALRGGACRSGRLARRGMSSHGGQAGSGADALLCRQPDSSDARREDRVAGRVAFTAKRCGVRPYGSRFLPRPRDSPCGVPAFRSGTAASGCCCDKPARFALYCRKTFTADRSTR